MKDNQPQNIPGNGFGSFFYIEWKSWWNNNRLQFWTSVWILGGIFLGIEIMCILIDGHKFQLGVLLIWALAFFFAGSLIGCIFGVPKAVAQDVKVPTPVVPASNPPVNPPDESSIASAETNTVKKPAPKGNTNLTDISEWLTKIVIGAGLVEIKTLPKFILNVGRHMAKGIDLLSTMPHSDVLCAGLLVYYTSFGLIAGYFVMRSIFIDVI